MYECGRGSLGRGDRELAEGQRVPAEPVHLAQTSIEDENEVEELRPRRVETASAEEILPHCDGEEALPARDRHPGGDSLG
eukprot:7972619-Alexandrium_andersonii.AAC.1